MSSSSSSFPLLQLPSEVLSNVLGSFLDGKSISTFLIVVQGCHDCHDDGVMSLIRDALVHRYAQLQTQLEKKVTSQENDEIGDVLMVLREDIRTCEESHFSRFPQWCAVLDYFEGQVISSSAFLTKGLMIWCGPIETAFGVFQACLYCSPSLWTLGALHYWYHEIELQQFAIVHPFSRDFASQGLLDEIVPHYGTIQGLSESDTCVVQRQHVNLEEDRDHWQHYLVLRNKSYEDETSEIFTPKIGDDTSLFCYWDPNEQGYDWEEALDRLGEHVVRIMTRCLKGKGSYP